MLKQRPWICAAILWVSLICGLTPAARADGAPAESSIDFQLALQDARRERNAGLALTGIGVGLATIGGLIGGLGPHEDRAWRGGLGIGVIGGILALPGAITAVYGAAHLSGLRLRSDFAAEETSARRGEVAGALMFVGGLALAGAGAGMVITGLGPFCFSNCGDTRGNATLLGVGFTMSVIGDLLWLSGMFVWPWEAGRKRGIREARSALNITPFGVAGTF